MKAVFASKSKGCFVMKKVIYIYPEEFLSGRVQFSWQKVVV